MSSTIFYKGTLKEDATPDGVYRIVSTVLGNSNTTLNYSENMIAVQFLSGKSEPLVFQFIHRRIDGFCKWNGDNAEEFYKILELFYQLRPLFKRLTVDDDEGVWQEYVTQKTPCKIELRPLSEEEKRVVGYALSLSSEPMTEVEELVYKKSHFIHTPNKALLRLIIRDFITLLNLKEPSDFKPEQIIKAAKELNYWGDGSFRQFERPSDFNWFFSWMLLEIWLSNAFTYKGKEIVKDLPSNTRGLKTSKEAAFEGIRSLFLNCHTGGASNAKEAEMRKLAKKHYRTGALGDVVISGDPERVFALLFSMLDYLGLKYIGVSAERHANL